MKAKRLLIATLALGLFDCATANAQAMQHSRMAAAQSRLMSASQNLTRILMGVSSNPSISLPTGQGTNSPGTVSSAINAYGAALTTFIETADQALISAETAARTTAEAGKVPTTAIGTTVAPLPLPYTDLPAATPTAPGVMSLTAAGQQAPIQTVAGRGGPAITLTHVDITDWAAAVAAQIAGGGSVGSCAAPTVLTYGASGNSLATAPVLTANENIITSCPTGTGVRLPLGVNLVQTLHLENRCGAAVLVYPASTTSTIENGTAGVAVTIQTTPDARFVNTVITNATTTNWNQ